MLTLQEEKRFREILEGLRKWAVFQKTQLNIAAGNPLVAAEGLAEQVHGLPFMHVAYVFEEFVKSYTPDRRTSHTHPIDTSPERVEN